MWILTSLSYFGRNIPDRIWRFLKKTFTTTYTLTSYNETFHLFLEWYQSQGLAEKGRYVKVSNGQWGDGKMVGSLGYGKQIFRYGGRFVSIELESQKVAGTTRDKDAITLVTLGRSHSVFDRMLTEVCQIERSKNLNTIKRYDGWWATSSEQDFRSFDTIFLNKGIKEQILKFLDRFLSLEQVYKDAGWNYQTGILLYGPPGTGKTSVIKAIAKYIEYQLCLITSKSVKRIEDAMFNLQPKSLVVIEDIDILLKNGRKEEVVKAISARGGELPEDEKEAISLSDMLNSIDGIHSINGRILIATTNNVESLDEALIRDGRFDLRLKIDYADEYIIKSFFQKFYPNFDSFEGFKIKHGTAPATIEKLIKQNLHDPWAVIDELRR